MTTTPVRSPEPVRATVDQRAARGRAARADAPRGAHGEFVPDPARPGPVDLLTAQDAGRLTELLPVRYGRMAASPFSFYRGAAAVMACDLAGTPASGITVQLCGDAHLSNFGFFASPERRLVFDLNDFDETLRGPWEWDVKRLVTSVEIAARERGLRKRDRRALAGTAARSYRLAMRRFATMTDLDVWYSRLEVEQIRIRYARELRGSGRRLDRGIARAHGRDNMGALRRFTTTTADGLRLTAAPPLVVPLRELLPARAVADQEALLRGFLRDYRDSLPSERRVLFDGYHLVDIARKVVGVGSVGTRSWMLLLLGRDDRDPLFLQAKEAGPSVLEEYLGPAPQDSPGRRVIEGQRLMQAVGDIFLGRQEQLGLDGVRRDFYVRQLRDWKASVEVEAMVPQGMAVYAELCGWTLARAHARSGDRVAVAAYLGSGSAFDRAMVRFAHRYADLNDRDHRSLLDAVRDGRIEATTGV
ncbi:DUF2252 domain-containing protein [Pseudonocardia kongjuensis]|uniref:DUF2252 domain-containing protein n=1 Tax=Pseudonocardia kongjuensis TaxID=102227 RepID=A0ABN1XWU6_9PSEU